MNLAVCLEYPLDIAPLPLSYESSVPNVHDLSTKPVHRPNFFQ